MAFKNFPDQQQGVELLQRSLARGRLAHSYLFTGNQLEELEVLARTLAKTLNCQNPERKTPAKPTLTLSPAVDCCDHCPACQKIERGNHADVHWVRPESKSRIITIEQMRDLMKEIQLKPTEAEYKVAVVVAADRLRVEGANAFLKTLEEPPPKSILILLTVEPQRILETILSRCLRLNFGYGSPRPLAPAQTEWLSQFTEMASAQQKSLLGRYRLMDVVLRKLNEMKAAIEANLTTRSPLQQYKDAEKDLVEKWETELAAAIEAEYRHQRADLLAVLQWWLRDVWVQTLPAANGGRRPEAGGPGEVVREGELLSFPQLASTQKVAQRISAAEAMENLETLEQLQRRLHTNVQEALALEIGLLKLRL